MKKKIIVNQQQFSTIKERVENKKKLEDLNDVLSNLDCATDDLRSLVQSNLENFGYQDILIKFLKKEEKGKLLTYIAYTEGPIIVFKAQSEIREDQPCLDIVDVKVYNLTS